jgi:hypothetical protein
VRIQKIVTFQEVAEAEALGHVESLEARFSEENVRLFEAWNRNIFETVQAQVKDRVSETFSTKTKTRRLAASRPETFRARVPVILDPLSKPALEASNERKIMARINSVLEGKQSESVLQRSSEVRSSTLTWVRCAFNGTQEGMISNMEIKDEFRRPRLSLPVSNAKKWDTIPRGRKHVSLHSFYYRNPIV